MNDATNKPDDGKLAIFILVVSIVGVGIGLYLYFIRNKTSNSSEGVASSFTPPAERQKYILAREKTDMANPAQKEELKKLLMHRALKAIPILLNLQNEGQSVDRLYRKGMLTDDMHYRMKEMKAFVDQEFADVQSEADQLVAGWGQHVWPQAMQFHQMVQKQFEERDAEAQKLEEKKKKTATDKKKDKVRKPLKDLAREGESAADAELLGVSSASAPSSSSSSTTTASATATSAADASVNGIVSNPAKLKEMESEKMARQLIEEEEKDRKNKKSRGKK